MRSEKTFSICLEEAINEYADMVYRIAMINMKSKSDAEDVFQEVFLRLVKYVETIKSKEHLKPWLIRVTINCCKKQFDSAWSRKTVSLEEEGQPDEAIFNVEEEDSFVYNAVRGLPESQREVIHLFYYEEYSIKEIGQILEQSESAVKTRLSRARDKLRIDLKGEFGDARPI